MKILVLVSYNDSKLKGSYLLMSTKNVPNLVASGEGLVDLHGAASRVCKDSSHILSFQRLDKHVGAFPGFPPEAILPISAVRRVHFKLQRGIGCIPSCLKLHRSIYQ